MTPSSSRRRPHRCWPPPLTALLAVGIGLTPAVSGCAARRAYDALLVVHAPGPSHIYVDDLPVGPVAGRPIGLRAGLHRVEVRAEGFLSAYREVELRAGERRTLDVQLHPDLDAEEAAPPPASEPSDPPRAPR